jgi:hypothetical protein
LRVSSRSILAIDPRAAIVDALSCARRADA